MDFHDAAVGDCDLDIPIDGRAAGRGMGVRGAGMGRLLGMGSGGECQLPAVADFDGVSAFGDDAGEEGDDEGVEYRAGGGHVLPLHFWDVYDAKRNCCLGPCVCVVEYWELLFGVFDAGDRVDDLHDIGAVGLFEIGIGVGKRRFAGIEFSV